MFWLWYTLLINLAVIPWITKAIALTAMSGISVTTVILFKRVFNSDFIVEDGRISRRKSSPKSAPSSKATDSSEKVSESQPEPDLYEPMEDTYKGLPEEVEPEKKPTGKGKENGFRRRLHGVADNVAAATTVAAVNN